MPTTRVSTPNRLGTVMSKRRCQELEVGRCLLETGERNRQPEEKEREREKPGNPPAPKVVAAAPEQERQGSRSDTGLEGPVGNRVESRPDEHRDEPQIAPFSCNLPQRLELVNDQPEDHEGEQDAVLVIVLAVPCALKPAKHRLPPARAESLLESEKPDYDKTGSNRCKHTCEAISLEFVLTPLLKRCCLIVDFSCHSYQMIQEES